MLAVTIYDGNGTKAEYDTLAKFQWDTKKNRVSIKTNIRILVFLLSLQVNRNKTKPFKKNI